MDRRAFVKTVGGLAIITAFSAAGVVSFTGQSPVREVLFTTPPVELSGSERGPVMQAGIQLALGSQSIEGQYLGTTLFAVDELGAALIQQATGENSIDDITLRTAEKLNLSLTPASVAQFFVNLGQAGFLANRVEVNLCEISA